MIKNGANKCVKIDVTTDLVLLVDYEAPDLLTGDEAGAAQAQRRRSMTGRDGEEEDEEEPKLGEEGLDSRYNQNRRRAVRV